MLYMIYTVQVPYYSESDEDLWAKNWSYSDEDDSDGDYKEKKPYIRVYIHNFVVYCTGGKNFWWEEILVVRFFGGGKFWWEEFLVGRIFVLYLTYEIYIIYI